MTSFHTDIQFLKGVGEKRAQILKSKGIDTIGALLRYYPRTYTDLSKSIPIENCVFGEKVCIRAKIVTEIDTVPIRQGMTLYKFMAEDETGTVLVTLFNQKYLARQLNRGSSYLFYGKMGGSFINREMSSPDIFNVEYAGIHPVYATFGTLTSKAIEKLIKNALELTEFTNDCIPENIRKRNNLCNNRFAFENIHFPRTKESLERAQKRLIFEELFVLRTGLLLIKNKSHVTAGSVLKKDYTDEFLRLLPFELTSAQKRAIDEATKDMLSGHVMNRLIEGDVGSGKTAVAAALCFSVSKNGFQSALMAPTEILAEQHYNTLRSILNNTGVEVGILTGSTPKKQKTEIKELLKQGKIDIIVGTHALLVDDVEFSRLGLVITDEQHRFGVAQRAKLSAKGKNTHTLVMSATPIPQTLALIIFGDLDISIIDEYPKGRQKVDTYLVNSSYHKRIYHFIKKHLDAGRQAYIVCPLVDENEELDITSANEYYESLSSGEFRNYSVGLIHGKMSSKQKESIMRAFKDGKIQLLVSTTVIEVGIDVPNAVIMVIENADRFGLSQLHQLRGRIGRGEYKSCCILISDSKTPETAKRLQVIKNSCDGFKIANADLQMRGPGDLLGKSQHGIPYLKIADLMKDSSVLETASKEAEKLLEQDNRIKNPEHALLRAEIISLYKKLNQN